MYFIAKNTNILFFFNCKYKNIKLEDKANLNYCIHTEGMQLKRLHGWVVFILYNRNVTNIISIIGIRKKIIVNVLLISKYQNQ